MYYRIYNSFTHCQAFQEDKKGEAANITYPYKTKNMRHFHIKKTLNCWY